MSFSARYLPAVLLTILSFPTSLWAQATPKQTTKAPRGSISGRVTIKEKSAEGVVVSLRKSDYQNPYEPAQRATTDQDGFYRIANVPAGSYEVSPAAPAFVPSDTKNPRGKSVLVGEDENVENINFALVRGGVITGRVTDADGRPVIQQQVFIYRADPFEQQPQTAQRPLFVAKSAPTDDRGIYRVFGLAAGRYKVGAGLSDDIYNAQVSGARSIYKPVFHPDVSDQAKATVFEVGEGTEATNVDITLGRVMQTFAVAGRVVEGERGLPVPNLRLGLRRHVGRRQDFVNTNTTTNVQGDFLVEGLIPGKYGIFLMQMQNQNNGLRLEAVTFDIIDQDLRGLTVKLVSGASLSGVVVLETENKAALAKLPELQLFGYVTDPSGNSSFGSSASSSLAPDGSFQLTGLPGGRLNLSIGARSSPFPAKGFNIARVERDGVTAAPGLEIKDGEQLTGIRVVLAYGNATLRGVVNLENGTLPTGARIFVRLTKPGENNSNMMPPQVDARGRFLIEGLATGMYEVHVAISGLPTKSQNLKREVSVQDGVITDITITLDMSTPPKP